MTTAPNAPGAPQPRKTAEELVEDLGRDWKRWQKFLSAATGVVLVISSWILLTLYSQNGKLSKLEDVPTDVKSIDGRLQEVEKKLVNLDPVPTTLKNLDTAVTAARLGELPGIVDSLNQRIRRLEDLPRQLAKSDESLQETARELAKLNDIPPRIEKLQEATRENEQRITESIAMLRDQAEQIAKIEATFTTELRQLVGEALGGNSTLIRMPLREYSKPLDSDDGVVFVFRSEMAATVALQKYAGRPIVQSIQILGFPADKRGPLNLVANAEFSGSALVVSLWTTEPGELDAVLQAEGLLAAIQVNGSARP